MSPTLDRDGPAKVNICRFRGLNRGQHNLGHSSLAYVNSTSKDCFVLTFCTETH